MLTIKNIIKSLFAEPIGFKRWMLVLCGIVFFTTASYAQKPVAFYLKNLPCPRIGTDSDKDIIKDLEADDFVVIEVDCSLFPKTSPALEDRLVEFHLQSPEFIKSHIGSDSNIDYGTIMYVPAGYRVARNIPVWNLLKYGAKNNMDKIMKSYNTDVVKKYKVKKADTPEAMVDLNGRPLDYNLYIDFIYPSGTPKQKVPLLLNFSSNAPRFYPFSPKAEKQIAYRAVFPIGFLVSGYAFANLDHCFIPTAKRGVYSHFKDYSLDKYNAVAYVTSSIRYIRSVADKYNLNGRIGTMGISKASYSAVIAANVHNNTMKEALPDYGAVNLNQPYQGYSSSVDVSYAASGDGTWRLPQIIDSESAPMVTSMGKHDKFVRHWDAYPVVLSHLNKVNNIHLDLWMEELGHTYPGMGDDFTTGIRRYSLIKTFFDRYLKPDEHISPEVFYILPKQNTEDVNVDGTFRTLIPDALLPKDMKDVPTDDVITVRFLSAMNLSSIKENIKIENQKTKKAVQGTWEASMKNTCFKFTPAGVLDKATTYVIKVADVTTDVNGNKLGKNAERYFATKK